MIYLIGTSCLYWLLHAPLYVAYSVSIIVALLIQIIHILQELSKPEV